MIPRVFIPTCKKYYHILRAYAYLHQIYWSEKQPVVIGGYEPLPFDLPPNFSFHSIAPKSYPKERWLKGVLEFLDAMPDPICIIMLEDYLLCRRINHDAIRTLTEYMWMNPDILRIDLTTDRLYAGKVPRTHEMKDIMYGHYDLFETDPERPYFMSTQAAIWNRALLLRFIRRYIELNGSQEPWQFEIHGSKVLREEFPDVKVLGTRQNPVRYAIAIKQNDDWKGKLDLRGIEPQHVKTMRNEGYFTGWETEA